jgi:hypothetical protein
VVEYGAGTAVEGSSGHAPDGSPGGLYLDHLGSEVREHHCAPGAKPDVAQVCDPYIVQDFNHNLSWLCIYSNLNSRARNLAVKFYEQTENIPEQEGTWLVLYDFKGV